MQINRWPFIGVLLAAALIGAGAVIASTVVNHRTSTDVFLQHVLPLDGLPGLK